MVIAHGEQNGDELLVDHYVIYNQDNKRNEWIVGPDYVADFHGNTTIHALLAGNHFGVSGEPDKYAAGANLALQKFADGDVAGAFGALGEGFVNAWTDPVGATPGSTLKTQSAKHSLINAHDGKTMFGLRPDLLVMCDKQTLCVMDTKWKLLDASDRKSNYGISQSDMYQLYAYGHKYLKGVGQKRLMLIYPKTDKFQVPLPEFQYEDGFTLQAAPFDLEMGKLIL